MTRLRPAGFVALSLVAALAVAQPKPPDAGQVLEQATQPLPDGLEKYQRLIDKLVEKDRDARFRNSDEVVGFLSRKFYQGIGGPEQERTQKLH